MNCLDPETIKLIAICAMLAIVGGIGVAVMGILARRV
jgi:hypothetical protein